MKNILKIYSRPAFLLCIATLALASGLMPAMKSYYKIKTFKKALPLKKSFTSIDPMAMSPYEIVSKITISNKDIIKALGTEDYLQCVVRNTEDPDASSTRFCTIFVTYYTGDADVVPHVPDECYTGGGNQRVGKESADIVIYQDTSDSNGPLDSQKTEQIPTTYLTFVNSSRDILQPETKFVVLYFFRVNGEYTGKRTATRVALMGNLYGEYSYYSKVELQFYNFIQGVKIPANGEETLAATQKLLTTVLPYLEQEHWPDWKP